MDSIRATMNRAIYSAASANDETPNLNPTRQSLRTTPVQKSQISLEAGKAMLSELLKNLEMSKISLQRETPLIQIIDTPVYPLQIERASKVKYSIIGCILSTIVISAYLVLQKLLKDIMA